MSRPLGITTRPRGPSAGYHPPYPARRRGAGRVCGCGRGAHVWLWTLDRAASGAVWGRVGPCVAVEAGARCGGAVRGRVRGVVTRYCPLGAAVRGCGVSGSGLGRRLG